MVNRPWRKLKVTERRAAEDFAVCGCAILLFCEARRRLFDLALNERRLE